MKKSLEKYLREDNQFSWWPWDVSSLHSQTRFWCCPSRCLHQNLGDVKNDSSTFFFSYEMRAAQWRRPIPTCWQLAHSVVDGMNGLIGAVVKLLQASRFHFAVGLQIKDLQMSRKEGGDLDRTAQCGDNVHKTCKEIQQLGLRKRTISSPKLKSWWTPPAYLRFAN